MIKVIFCIVMLVSFASPLSAQEREQIKLPAPQLDSGKLLMQALKERRSTRSFSPRQIPIEEISNLLWSANGINRPETGKRTAPSANNRQEIAIYAATAEGLYLYDPKEHALRLIVRKDIRSLTGSQPFVKDAPINLIYVADLSKAGNINADDRILITAADTGFISQNVYLYCASAGLATVVRGSMDRDALAKAMQLSENQKIILAQTIGYPKE